jgi:hypothetical protein
MLLKKKQLTKIKDGKICLVFRKWVRPTVKAGGTLRTSIGVLSIDEMVHVELTDITEKEANKAGYTSKSELINDLNKRDKGKIYRIKVHYIGNDPRKVLQNKDNLTSEELFKVSQKLKAIDKRSQEKPWTYSVLMRIMENPGMKSADLAQLLNFEKGWLKNHIRKLKELGLTISLKPGYKLSPRGLVVLKYLKEIE